MPANQSTAQTGLGHRESGFTLIELSIVLVIIGLIVGGVLVGQDLIRAAEVRATISQIEKYNTAVNTFRGKYNAFPGDMNAATATQFNFASRGSNSGQGDGNGVIEGYTGAAASGFYQFGETSMFWVDLSTANGNNVNLVDGSFSTATETYATAVTSSTINQWFPPAKLGRGNYIYVYSTNGTNYYGMSAVSALSNAGAMTSTATMTVQQAYQIDKKVDDGFPATGSVTANYDTGAIAENGTAVYAAGNGVGATWTSTGTIAAQTNGGSTTCYDNSNTANAQAAYSLAQNNGAGANCALSFRFQ